MSGLSDLSPKLLWQHFANICAIPHPSYHEEALAQHIITWSKDRRLWCERDQTGNILIRKPATAGMDNRIPVALQAHLDMVPQKNNDSSHDFTRDPIEPRIDGEWVKADGTTLGADNGIGLASTLAVLEDNSLKHGPLEVLLTMTEEVGMEGAFALQPHWLKAKMLINTDSEEEGEIFVGCAGGIDVVTTLPLARESLPENDKIYRLSLTGLKGGHSGAEIHCGLGNANKLLARFLADYCRIIDLRLLDFQGGTLRNAIPREAFAIIAVAADSKDKLKSAVEEYGMTLKNEFSVREKNLSFSLETADSDAQALTRESQDKYVALMNSLPNGVMRYSDMIEGVVETSLNVGIIEMQENEAKIHSLVRSLIDSGRDAIVGMLTSLGDLAGAKTLAQGAYPGWQPDTHSPLVSLVSKTYESLFTATPEIQVIHAGLECGLFKLPYPDMDMVSFGPTIVGPHSPDEAVNIESVARYWQLLTAVLAAIPEKTAQ